MTLHSQTLSKDRKNETLTPGALPQALNGKRLLLVVILLATLLRLLSALLQGETVAPLPGIHDQISYDGLARRVLAGFGFSFGEDHWPATRAGEPTAHWSYLYTLYLTIVYGGLGIHPLAARLIQAVVAGVLHCWLTWRVGRRIFGPVVGIVAAGLSAVYLYFVYYAGSLITETFYIIAILWTLDVALRLAGYGETPAEPARPARSEWPRWLELGLALGVTVLLRQLFLLFMPFLFLWLWWVRWALPRTHISVAGDDPALVTRRRVRTWQGLFLATTLLVLLILPWTVRNYRAFGILVPLNTNSGFAFFWGNHPIYGTHFVGILPSTGPSYEELIPSELLPLSEAKLDQALLKRGIGFIVDDPRRYVLLSLSRMQEYFKFWPSSESSGLSNLVRLASFGLMLPFIVHGLVLSLWGWRAKHGPRERAALVLLYSFIVIYTAIHLLTWALIRYRLPVDAIFLLFAAYSITHLVEAVVTRRRIWSS